MYFYRRLHVVFFTLDFVYYTPCIIIIIVKIIIHLVEIELQNQNAHTRNGWLSSQNPFSSQSLVVETMIVALDSGATPAPPLPTLFMNLALCMTIGNHLAQKTQGNVMVVSPLLQCGVKDLAHMGKATLTFPWKLTVVLPTPTTLSIG